MSPKNRSLELLWYGLWAVLDPYWIRLSGEHEGAAMRLEDLMPSGESSPGERPGTMCDEAFAAAHPGLWMLCSQPVDSAGKRRELATIVFFVDEGLWKCRLSERNTCYDLWAGGETFDAALASLEAQLSKVPVPWRKAQVRRGK